MPIKEKDNRYMHSRLPIGKDEKILAIYKHHWFSYASIWFIGIIVVLVLMTMAVFLTSGADTSTGLAQYKKEVLAGTFVFSGIVLVFTGIPVYLRSEEQIVLTEEALLQIVQPTIFANKISQLNLAHIADVSVRQDFFGTMFGFGKVSVETPGEQDNYEFFAIAQAQDAAKAIVEAHENYQAALQSGRMPSSYSALTPKDSPVQVDPEQYQQFLAYQQAQAAQSDQQPIQQARPVTDQASTQPFQTDPTQVPTYQPQQQPTDAAQDQDQTVQK